MSAKKGGKRNITAKVKQAVALKKLEGKTWPQIMEETGIAHATIARILRDDDTRRFMAEIRAGQADKLAAAYELIVQTAVRDLQNCTDPVLAIKLRRHLLTIVTAQHSGRGGDRSQHDGPLVSIDNRNHLPPAPEGVFQLRDLLQAIRQPAQKEDIN